MAVTSVKLKVYLKNWSTFHYDQLAGDFLQCIGIVP